MRTGARAIAWVLLAASTASADPSASARAQSHFREGQRLQDAARFDDAIAEYQAAYDLVPLPGLLFNLGQAYRLKGDRPEAIKAYERYLLADPDGRAAPVARKHLVRLRAEMPAIRPRPLPEPAEPIPEPPPPEPSLTVPEPPPVSAPIAPVGRDERDEPEPRRGGKGLRVAGIVTGVTGLALAGGAVFFGLRARSLAQDVETTYDPDKVSDGENAEKLTLILGAAGGAAVLTGGILFFLGSRSSERGVAVAPSVYPAGLVAAGRF